MPESSNQEVSQKYSRATSAFLSFFSGMALAPSKATVLMRALGPSVMKKVRDFRSASRDLMTDRKSTRLNSSHSQISYAVFCLKKKKTYDRLRARFVDRCRI